MFFKTSTLENMEYLQKNNSLYRNTLSVIEISFITSMKFFRIHRWRSYNRRAAATLVLTFTQK